MDSEGHRETKRERERDRQTDRQTNRERQRETERRGRESLFLLKRKQSINDKQTYLLL